MLRSRTQLVVPVLLTLILPTVLGAAPLTPRLLGVKFKDGGAAKDDDKISAIRADVVAALEKVDDAVRALPANGEASLQSSVRLEIANLSESMARCAARCERPRTSSPCSLSWSARARG